MKTLIAVKYPILREGIEKVLSERPEISIKDTARNTDELLSVLPDEECILILDLKILDSNGSDFVRKLLEKNQELRILAIGEDETQNQLKEIMQAGASGYIGKKQSTSELIKALQKINKGDFFLCDEAICKFYSKTGEDSGRRMAAVDLTNRETEVLSLICQELTNREIANKLSISVRTVDAHRRNILQKTGARNTAGLVKYAIKYQIYNLSS
jgi:DNA-binding NarL/FixJ family response regulator